MTALQALRELNSAATSNSGANHIGLTQDFNLIRYATAPVETDSAWYPSLKRGFDVIASALLLIALSPLMLIVAIAIRLESKGPVFFFKLVAASTASILTFLSFVRWLWMLKQRKRICLRKAIKKVCALKWLKTHVSHASALSSESILSMNYHSC